MKIPLSIIFILGIILPIAFSSELILTNYTAEKVLLEIYDRAPFHAIYYFAIDHYRLKDLENKISGILDNNYPFLKHIKVVILAYKGMNTTISIDNEQIHEGKVFILLIFIEGLNHTYTFINTEEGGSIIPPLKPVEVDRNVGIGRARIFCDKVYYSGQIIDTFVEYMRYDMFSIYDAKLGSSILGKKFTIQPHEERNLLLHMIWNVYDDLVYRAYITGYLPVVVTTGNTRYFIRLNSSWTVDPSPFNKIWFGTYINRIYYVTKLDLSKYLEMYGSIPGYDVMRSVFRRLYRVFSEDESIGIISMDSSILYTRSVYERNSRAYLLQSSIAIFSIFTLTTWILAGLTCRGFIVNDVTGEAGDYREVLRRDLEDGVRRARYRILIYGLAGIIIPFIVYYVVALLGFTIQLYPSGLLFPTFIELILYVLILYISTSEGFREGFDEVFFKPGSYRERWSIYFSRVANTFWIWFFFIASLAVAYYIAMGIGSYLFVSIAIVMAIIYFIVVNYSLIHDSTVWIAERVLRGSKLLSYPYHKTLLVSPKIIERVILLGFIIGFLTPLLLVLPTMYNEVLMEQYCGSRYVVMRVYPLSIEGLNTLYDDLGSLGSLDIIHGYDAFISNVHLGLKTIYFAVSSSGGGPLYRHMPPYRLAIDTDWPVIVTLHSGGSLVSKRIKYSINNVSFELNTYIYPTSREYCKQLFYDIDRSILDVRLSIPLWTKLEIRPPTLLEDYTNVWMVDKINIIPIRNHEWILEKLVKEHSEGYLSVFIYTDHRIDNKYLGDKGYIIIDLSHYIQRHDVKIQIADYTHTLLLIYQLVLITSITIYFTETIRQTQKYIPRTRITYILITFTTLLLIGLILGYISLTIQIGLINL